ncbi:MAG: hypothetical protein LBJ36_09990 [Synergistaceae bacterium]|nr:hypothetical protein [Synergistaceae bacterium]
MGRELEGVPGCGVCFFSLAGGAPSVLLLCGLSRRGLTAYAVFGVGVQRRLLGEEGVGFTVDGRVDMKKYAWDGR